MAKICLFASAHQAMQPIRALVNNLKDASSHGIQYQSAAFGTHQLILCVAGVGMVNTAMSSSILAHIEQPDYLLSCGVAGGASPELAILDVVIASEVISPEYTSVKVEFNDTPFEDTLLHPHKNIMMPAWLASAMMPILDVAAYDFKVVLGRVASSDQFPAPIIEYPDLVQEDLKAIDMETAALYQVGWVMDIPCFAVRAISNSLLSDGVGPEMGAANFSEASQHAAKVALDLIQQLK